MILATTHWFYSKSKHLLAFRVGNMRHTSLVEAHVRAILIRFFTTSSLNHHNFHHQYT